MNRNLRCDWLTERARWRYLARSGIPAVSRKKNFPESHIINPLLTKLVLCGAVDIWVPLKIYFPPAVSYANFSQRWWHQKWNKGQRSSWAVTGGTGVNGFGKMLWERGCMVAISDKQSAMSVLAWGISSFALRVMIKHTRFVQTKKGQKKNQKDKWMFS